MRYIDADRLKAEIKRQIRLEELNFAALGGGGQTFCTNTLEWVLKRIDSLQQEQSSLPDNLDEAAHSYSESDEPLYSPGHRYHWDNDSLFGEQIETAFKAGAEWMAKQMNNDN